MVKGGEFSGFSFLPRLFPRLGGGEVSPLETPIGATNKQNKTLEKRLLPLPKEQGSVSLARQEACRQHLYPSQTSKESPGPTSLPHQPRPRWVLGLHPPLAGTTCPCLPPGGCQRSRGKSQNFLHHPVVTRSPHPGCHGKHVGSRNSPPQQ